MTKLTEKFIKQYQHLHIVDTSYILYREFWSKPLLEYNGKKTGHFKGLCDFCVKLYETIQTLGERHCVIFVFDSLSTARSDIFPGYKKSLARVQQKEKAPLMNIDYDNFRHIIGMFPDYYSVDLKGYEADDIIMYIGKNYSDKVEACSIYTKDYDLFSLAKNKRILFMETANNNINVRDKLRNHKKFKNPDPAQVPLLKILNGDTSDNIPPILDLRKARKVLEQWMKAGKIFLTPELKDKKAELQRNIKLVMPLRIDEPLRLVGGSAYPWDATKKIIFNHGILSFISFLKKNKQLLKLKKETE